jgi:hypothetical protein
VTAVGSTVTEDDKPGFEVFLAGMDNPLVIGFDTEDEAVEARNELIAIIAQYHYTRELGPDFDINDLMDDKDDEGINEH